MKRKFIRKADFIIIGILILIAVLALLPRFVNDENVIAEISQNGSVLYTVDLSTVTSAYEIVLDGAVILVEPNVVSFKSSTCPDKLCVNCGKLKNKGDIAACVPTKAVVRIIGESKNSVDAVAF